MSFQTDEVKVEQPVTAELYIILCGNTTYRLTSFSTDVTHGSHVYRSTQISRSVIKRSLSVSDNSGVSVELKTVILPIDNELFNSTNTFNITILRKHVVSGSSRSLFIGTVQSFSTDGSILRIDCFDVKYRLLDNVPKVQFTTYCNNQLYDSVCGLNVSLFTAAITGNLVTINSPIAYGSNILDWQGLGRGGTRDGIGYFYASVGNTPSCILDYSDLTAFPVDGNYASQVGANILGGVLTHLRTGKSYVVVSVNTLGANKTIGVCPIISDFAIGDTFTIKWGCPKSRSVCVSRFDNIGNFVGFPFMPNRDVVSVLAVS